MFRFWVGIQIVTVFICIERLNRCLKRWMFWLWVGIQIVTVFICIELFGIAGLILFFTTFSSIYANSYPADCFEELWASNWEPPMMVFYAWNDHSDLVSARTDLVYCGWVGGSVLGLVMAVVIYAVGGTWQPVCGSRLVVRSIYVNSFSSILYCSNSD